MRASAAMSILLVACFALLAIHTVSAQSQLVSYPTDLYMLDPSSLNELQTSPIMGTLDAGGDYPDVQFKIHAQDEDGSMQVYRQVLQCEEGVKKAVFGDESTLLVKDQIDDGPPDCVIFGMNYDVQESFGARVYVTLSAPTTGLLMVIAPTSTYGLALQDIVLSEDFEIIADGCTREDGTVIPAPCKPIKRVAPGQLNRAANSKGVIRFNKAITTLIIVRHEVCGAKFDFTLALQKKVDCVQAPATEWSECDATCGSGSQNRTLFTVRAPLNGGKACLPEVETQACPNLPICSADCDVSDWSEWTACSASCGGGTRTAERVIEAQPIGTGAACPVTKITEACNTDACPIDCKMSEWTPFGECSASCGGGMQTRTRKTLVDAQFGGEDCEAEEESQVCNTAECPVDCEQSDWSPWGECSEKCGAGVQNSTRVTFTYPEFGGAACGPELQTQACSNGDCPVDCKVSEWTPFGECSASCGGGSKKRTRTITQEPLNGGADCPEREDVDDCNYNACPVDCKVGEWSAWSTCSQSCGAGGVSFRTREVLTPAAFDGAECPAQRETQPCNTQVCPTDCEMGDFSEWSECSKQCGGGTQTRTRTIDVQPANGGAVCLPTQQAQQCNTQACPVDCKMGDWSAWGTCSKTCGGGQSTRSRSVVTDQANGGAPCDVREETQPCNTPVCDVPCVMSPWTEFDQCDKPCGGGAKTRTRTIVTPSAGNGEKCGPKSDSVPCNTQACAVDCEMSEFGAWSTCSATCGGGKRTRVRDILVPTVATGAVCPAKEESEPCNTQECPVDCKMSEWSAPSSCTATCGGGTSTRKRYITQQPLFNGASCPVDEEITECNTQVCPTDCVMNEWTEWSTCSASCGSGVQKRTRDVRVEAKDNGAACPANVEEVRACNTVGCPVDCVMSPWVDTNLCSAACGGGVETWTRTVITQDSNGGLTCGDISRSEPCNTQACPTNCVVSEWSEFGQCSKTCGGGEQTRTRSIIAQPTNDGNRCPSTLKESIPCNTQGCPVDCVMGEFGPWSTCSASCGTGTQQRFRPTLVAPANGGRACPSSTDFQTCNTQKCAQDCVMSEWKEWTRCSRTCGGGLRLRYRTIAKFPSCGGDRCGSLIDIEKCNTQACDVDCKMGDWTQWGKCSKTCGGGEQTRSRNVVKARCGNGATCPPEIEKRACNTDACAQDCVQGPWSEWGTCSASCGGGVQTRERATLTAPTGCGKRCSFAKETRRCNNQVCPRDCEMGDWKPWGACSKKCGGGKMIRQRPVKKPKCGKGKTCSPIYEEKDCNTQACSLPKVDCAVSQWGAWSGCTKNCGGGSKTRTRTVTRAPQNGGKVCPVLFETALCNKQECPIDCKVTPFCEWSRCSKTCGGGKQVRTRSVINPQCGAGQVCPPLKEEQDCNTQACDQDCKVGDWSAWGSCSKQCGSGSQTRSRKITQAQSGKGRSCPALSETQTCNSQQCPVDCKVTDFGAWSTCSRTCGGGTQTRKRSVISQQCGSGSSCPALTETQACNTQVCEKDCKVSDWGCWGPCSKECGTGVQTRSRNVLQAPTAGGQQCPSLKDQQTCNSQACKQDCVVSAWSSFGSCSKSCGTGQQTRTRTVLVAPTNGGKACPALKDETCCNTQSCAVDCQVSDFGAWSGCSQSCGGGVQTRHRQVTVQARNGGKTCPCLSETQKCNTQSCTKGCEVSDWTNWSTCSKTCGGGWSYQYRKVTQWPSCGGDRCPALVNYKACNTQACVTDCKTSDWSSWGQCSKTCGGGVQYRKRVITQWPCRSGASCPSDLVQSQSCNTQACASDCKVSDFGAWSTCSKSCGGGVATRERVILSQPTGCGATCPPLKETGSCNTQACQQNCVVSAWSAFGECSKKCGGGVATRSRTVTVPKSGGGADCPVLSDSTACNTQVCPPGSTCDFGATSYVVKGNGVEVTFANGIDSIDVNIRITHSNGQTVTLNFHPNRGAAKGQLIFFDVTSHASFPRGCTNGAFCITWVQVNGSNCHFGENKEAPICGSIPQQCAWAYTAFGACSNQCGSGTQSRQAVCKTSSGAACDASKCGAAQLTQACSSQSGCGVGCQATSCSGDGSYSTVSFATGNAGVLAISIKYTQPTFGDLRGFFLEMAPSSRLSGRCTKCTLSGSAVTNFERDVKALGCDKNINLNGCAGPASYDLAVAFGTNGVSKDDIRSTTVYLACSGYTLTLDDVKDARVGVRAQSVGSSASRREDSSKQVCIVGNQ